MTRLDDSNGQEVALRLGEDHRFVSRLAAAFERDGFDCQMPAAFTEMEFGLVARKHRFQLTKMGRTSNFWVVHELTGPSLDAVRRVLLLAFRYSVLNKRTPSRIVRERVLLFRGNR